MHSQASEKHKQAIIDLNQVKSSIKNLREAIKASKGQFEELTQELSDLFIYNDWQERIQTPGFIDQLVHDATSYKGKQQEAQRLEHIIELHQSLVPTMQTIKSSITAARENNLISFGLISDMFIIVSYASSTAKVQLFF